MAEWELKIKPCPCSDNLEQAKDVKVANKEQSKCESCDLTQASGLWLCLTCGALGCSRSNFDGSGGNGHGAKHYDDTKHPMVVKMGTITPEGEASIFCYKCDDDIVDKNLI